ncbi:hypothetical protein DOY81_007910 [Sarcophaga bullata]|nr:hypothetical protein DOY81_007910 [Sarcophaga bullata]
MFKLVVLLTLFAVCLARPSLIASSSPYLTYSAPVASVAYQQHGLATVGAVVKTVPTSVSQASHAVVHKSDRVVQDIVAPVVKTTYTAPLTYTSYAAPIASYVAASPISHISSGSY